MFTLVKENDKNMEKSILSVKKLLESIKLFFIDNFIIFLKNVS